MRIVLDSNVLVASLGRKSKLRPIWNAFTEGIYQLIVSEDILKEYEEILHKHAAPGAAKIVMEIFIESPDVVIQKVYYNWNATSPLNRHIFRPSIQTPWTPPFSDTFPTSIPKRSPPAFSPS
jgi:hypothetical protein